MDEDSNRTRDDFHRDLAWANHARLSERACRSTLKVVAWARRSNQN